MLHCRQGRIGIGGSSRGCSRAPLQRGLLCSSTPAKGCSTLLWTHRSGHLSVPTYALVRSAGPKSRLASGKLRPHDVHQTVVRPALKGQRRPQKTLRLPADQRGSIYADLLRGGLRTEIDVTIWSA